MSQPVLVNDQCLPLLMNDDSIDSELRYQSESTVYKLSALTKHLTKDTPKLIMGATDTSNVVFHKLALSYMLSQTPKDEWFMQPD